MRPIRLLPIVIFAASALLVFKVAGLVTTGGYVLTGTFSAVASEETTRVGGEAAGQGPLLTDASPTLTDTAPTMAAGTGAGATSNSAGAPSGEADSSGGKPANPVAAAADGGEAAEAKDTPGPSEGAGDTAAGTDCPVLTRPVDPNAPKADMNHPLPPETNNIDAQPGALVELPADCPPPRDAQPVTEDAFGNKTPLTDADGGSLTDQALLTRLRQRDAELDAKARELDMRSALLDAAQKRLDERQAALEALQSKIDARIDSDKSSASSQFTAVVSMYETMRPKEAAAIFNSLDMGVLAKVARAMNPRKMAPIMASMDPTKAQALTVVLATDTLPPETAGSPDTGQLPQIVGH